MDNAAGSTRPSTRSPVPDAGTPKLELRRVRRHRLLFTDDVGYLPFGTAAAAQFFQLIAARYENGSVIVTANLPFS